MTGSQTPIIRVFTCEEHRCRIFNKLRILERANAGELKWKDDSFTPKKDPWTDHNGKLLTHNENKHIVDERFPSGDGRRIAAKTHRHIASDGTPGASGKYDPKTITTTEGMRYQPLPDDDSVCELCETGDMIAPWNRHYNSKYKPSIWRCLRVWFRAIIRS